MSGKLAPFSWFGPLSHFDLDFIGIYQVMGSHSETTTGYLFDCTTSGIAIFQWFKSFRILTTFARITSSPNSIHGNGQGFMCLSADGAIGHGTGHKTLHDILHRLHLLKGDGISFIAEQSPQKTGMCRFTVHQHCILLVLLVVVISGTPLEQGHRFRIPCMVLPIFSVGIDSLREHQGVNIFCIGFPVWNQRFLSNLLQTDPPDTTYGTFKIFVSDIRMDSNGFEDLRRSV